MTKTMTAEFEAYLTSEHFKLLSAEITALTEAMIESASHDQFGQGVDGEGREQRFRYGVYRCASRAVLEIQKGGMPLKWIQTHFRDKDHPEKMLRTAFVKTVLADLLKGVYSEVEESWGPEVNWPLSKDDTGMHFLDQIEQFINLELSGT